MGERSDLSRPNRARQITATEPVQDSPDSTDAIYSTSETRPSRRRGMPGELLTPLARHYLDPVAPPSRCCRAPRPQALGISTRTQGCAATE
jgi:hypothetical protein